MTALLVYMLGMALVASAHRSAHALQPADALGLLFGILFWPVLPILVAGICLGRALRWRK